MRDPRIGLELIAVEAFIEEGYRQRRAINNWRTYLQKLEEKLCNELEFWLA